jgi:hypothetical protein
MVTARASSALARLLRFVLAEASPDHDVVDIEACSGCLECVARQMCVELQNGRDAGDAAIQAVGIAEDHASMAARVSVGGQLLETETVGIAPRSPVPIDGGDDVAVCLRVLAVGLLLLVVRDRVGVVTLVG